MEKENFQEYGFHEREQKATKGSPDGHHINMLRKLLLSISIKTMA